METRPRHSLVTGFLPALLVIAACSRPGGNLLRHDVPDVWSGEAWSFEDLARAAEIHEGPGQDPGDRGVGTADEAGADVGPPLPVAFVADGEAFPVLLGLIQGARERVEVVHLEFLNGTLPDQVHDALLAAVARGVTARVLLERDVDGNAARVASLVAGGVQARLDSSSRTLHAKVVVADGTRVLVGSTNLSTSSLKYNHEANWLFTGGSPAEGFADYASRLWESDTDPRALDASGEDALRLIGDGQYVDAVRPLLEGATWRVLVIQYQVDSKDGDAAGLLQAVIGARARGADARVVLERSGFAEEVNAANEASRQVLVASGVGVRLDSPEVVTHAKMVVADDWVVLTSGNWVGSGLRKNHEAGAAVRSPELAGEAAAYFEAVWAAANP